MKPEGIPQRINPFKTVLIMIFIGSTQSSNVAANQKPGVAPPLPAELIAAWKKAGAFNGWMERGTFRPGAGNAKAGEIPAFQFFKTPAQAIADLPTPDAEFGIGFVGKATDEHILQLSRFKRLHSLNLRAQLLVTDAGLKGIAELKRLQFLQLQSCKVTDAGLKELSGLEKLRHLNLLATYVTDEGLKHLSGLKELEWFAVGPRLSGAGLKHLSAAKLTYLHIVAGSGQANEGLKELATLNNLETLVLDGGFPSDKSLDGTTGLKNLRFLDLTNTGVTQSGLKKLANLPQLETLVVPVTTTTVDKALAATLAGFQKLQTLHLDGSQQLLETELSSFAKVKTLRTLSLNRTKITNVGLKELAKIGQLQSLDLSLSPALTLAGLKELRRLKNLKTLTLGGFRSTREEVEALLPGVEIRGLLR